MNEILQSMLSAYLNAFDAYPISSDTLRAEVADFKARLWAFGEANDDIATFHQRFMDSGLQEEHQTLITKVVMASSGMANADGSPKTDYSDRETKMLSVAEFVEQYRTAYDSVRAAGYRKRGEAAYEAVFNVANRTDDMVEAQVILEKERLLWKIVTEDALDIFAPILEAMDPLHDATTILLRQQLETYSAAQSDEELTEMVELQELPRVACINRSVCKTTIAALMATLLIKYYNSKSLVWHWHDETSVKVGIKSMISLRAAMRRTLALLRDDWGLSFDDLCADESAKIWMLSPNNIDNFGRIKISMTPRNIEAFRDIVSNEILVDIDVAQCLMRPMPQGVWLAFSGAEAGRYQAKATRRAEELNAGLTYYKYLKELDAAYAQLGTQPGSA